MLLARGTRALHILQVAFEATMIHIADIGGRLAPKKSRLFATIAAHRVWLAAYVWDPIEQEVLLVYKLRDLGSSLSLTDAK